MTVDTSKLESIASAIAAQAGLLRRDGCNSQADAMDRRAAELRLLASARHTGAAPLFKRRAA